ncbi:MAG: PHP domain-containing protein [Lachnospiraceae bacterium]
MIDLHVHSTASDGTLTPTELVQEAIRCGLHAIALTDHDTVDGIEEMLAAAANYHFTVIPGIEISALENHREIHILGYGIDWKNSVLLEQLAKALAVRTNRNRQMIAKMHDAGFDIDEKQIAERFPNTIVTRMHFARFLLEKGYIETPSDAFKKYFNPGKPFFMEKKEMEPKQAIEAIHAAGGLAVLAHPNLYKKDEEQQRILLADLKGNGLDGIEAIYSLNTPEEEKLTRKLAMEFDLFITGGSDFHGANKPSIQMGIGRGNLEIPDEILLQIKQHQESRQKTKLTES